MTRAKFTKTNKPAKPLTKSGRLSNIKMRYKLLLVIWLVGLIPMIVVAGIATIIGVKTLEAGTKSKLSVYAENKHQMVVDWFRNQRSFLDTLAGSEEIIGALTAYHNRGTEWEQKKQSLAHSLNRIKGKNDYADIFIADVGGQIIINTIPENKNEQLTSDEIQVILSGGAGFEDMTYFESVDCMAVLLGSIVKPKVGSDQSLGYVGVYLSIDQINTMLNNGLDSMGKSANAYLIDSDRKLLTKPRFGDGFEVNQTVIDNEGARKLSKALTSMQVTENETLGYYNQITKQNVMANLSVISLPGQDLGVIIEIAEKEAYKPAIRMLELMALVILISIILQLILGSIFAKSIVNPLHAMVSNIKLIAAGDLTARVPKTSKDEIGEMASSLNQMLENLARIVHQIFESGRSVRKSAQQIATISQDLSERTQEEAATLEEVAATMEEVSASVTQAASNSERADKISKLTMEAVLSGEDSIEETRKAMGQLQQSSRQIREIIQTVNDLAFQTNLLALNAAIEAARAGEQGRGFAVVATEVRNLARRSAESAKEIEALIRESIVRVENGTAQVEQSSQMLKQIIENTKQTADVIAEVAIAMKEQALSAQQIQISIEQLNQVTQQNAAIVGDMSASSRLLNTEAGNLNYVVNQFKLNEQSEESEPVVNLEPAQPIMGKKPVVTADEFHGDDWSKF